MFSAILGTMPLYIFARFEPRPGKELQTRDELRRVLGPTREEPGCLRIHLYESARGPLTYYIHSEWVDEQAFDAHAAMPHTVRFAGAIEDLVREPLRAIRTKQIA
ncbi:MAG TPA: putative quinol monooxygenase [Bryobacteraceae bacterium]|nr:putative quinol monooxygenase [Bryobacteraceae bacterium]